MTADLVSTILKLWKWKRLQRSLEACYPGVEMKVIRAEELANLKAHALKAGYESDSDWLRRQLREIQAGQHRSV